MEDATSNANIEERLKKILEGVIGHFNIEVCVLLLFDDAGRELFVKYAYGIDEAQARSTRLKLGQKFSGWVLKKAEPLLIESIDYDPVFKDRSMERYYTGSVISLPILTKTRPFGVLNLNGKKDGSPFTQEEFKLAKSVASILALAMEATYLQGALKKGYTHAVKALVSAIDARDHYTSKHSEEVTKYATAIAKELKLSPQEIEKIREACELHDLGKIGVHDYILNKPGKLTETEWQEMKLHSLKSAEILEPLDFLEDVIELVRQHHERYDGQGYPYGYKGEAILLGARIMAVADAYHAMISKRPYRKKAYRKEEAITEIRKNAGTQFDPKVVEAFLKIADKF
jgi:putative nucleotidyltransferase with HDIG domain